MDVNPKQRRRHSAAFKEQARLLDHLKALDQFRAMVPSLPARWSLQSVTRGTDLAPVSQKFDSGRQVAAWRGLLVV